MSACNHFSPDVCNVTKLKLVPVCQQTSFAGPNCKIDNIIVSFSQAGTKYRACGILMIHSVVISLGLLQ